MERRGSFNIRGPSGGVPMDVRSRSLSLQQIRPPVGSPGKAKQSPRGRQSERSTIWEPDGENCKLCQVNFSWFTRRHHCRVCGRCVCSSCSQVRRACAGYSRVVRWCDECVRGDEEEEGAQKKGEETLKEGVLERAGRGREGQWTMTDAKLREHWLWIKGGGRILTKECEVRLDEGRVIRVSCCGGVVILRCRSDLERAQWASMLSRLAGRNAVPRALLRLGWGIRGGGCVVKIIQNVRTTCEYDDHVEDVVSFQSHVEIIHILVYADGRMRNKCRGDDDGDMTWGTWDGADLKWEDKTIGSWDGVEVTWENKKKWKRNEKGQWRAMDDDVVDNNTSSSIVVNNNNNNNNNKYCFVTNSIGMMDVDGNKVVDIDGNAPEPLIFLLYNHFAKQ